MHLQHVVWRNFRNIEQAEIEPDPGLNVLWGDNAQGKTNLLEGIYLLGTLKGFRGSRNGEFVRHGAGTCRVAGDLVSLGVRRRVELTVDSRKKTARLDNKDVRRVGHFIGHLKPILFSPDEVGLVKGYPAGRRSLLDRAVFLADPGYLGRAQEYGRYLRHRNLLLKEGKGEGETAPWTEGLIAAGARIRRDRWSFLNRLIPLFREAHRNITGGREEAELRYDAGAEDEDALRRLLRCSLEQERDRERRFAQTLAGPHRDDLQFLVDGRSARLYGSQGQQRSVMLAFKTAQIMDLENRTGEPPVLLLDDMTGELDRHRQGFFFRFLLARRGQVFITTTDIQPLISEGLSHARFFRVEGGRLTQDRQERGRI